jgi:hypothetical protein
VTVSPGLFVYGSLTFAEVLDVLLGRVPRHRPASADGWRVAALLDRPFPGLVAGQATATGLLLTDLTEDEAVVIDAFEGPMYDKPHIGLTDGTTALAYVCVDESLVLARDWDRAAFGTHELPDYLRRCRQWRASRDH